MVESHYFDPPDKIEDFVEALRDHLYTKGCVAIQEGGIQMHSCNYLIGHKGQLYEILMDFQLNKALGNYTAIGSGESHAMGALYILDKTYNLMPPIDKLQQALEAVSKFHINCGPPFTYEKI